MDGALSLPVVENRINGPTSLNFRDKSLHVALTHALIDGLSVKSIINNLDIVSLRIFIVCSFSNLVMISRSYSISFS